MSKLFDDSELFQKERPTKITEQQKATYCAEVAKEIKERGWSDSDTESIVNDLLTINPNDNGYEIAKDLEFDKDASYDIDSDFVSFLDDFGNGISDILAKNIEEWVAAHKLIPEFSKGQRLLIETSLNLQMKKGGIVFVTGISEKRACYWIDENENRKGGSVIPYEKVEKCCLKTE